jgi:hypothetical protein
MEFFMAVSNISEQENLYQIAKLGKLEHLQSIQQGKIRFMHIQQYRNIENKSIGDRFEGTTIMRYVENFDKITFSAPNLMDGKELNVTKSIQSWVIQPDTNYYIFCLTHFSNADIINKTIFDDKIYEEKEWSHVLFFLKPDVFIKTVYEKIKDAKPITGPVQYFDYTQSQYNLNISSKREEFKWQKEYRIGFDITLAHGFERVDEHTVVFDIGDISNQSFIIPREYFCDGFIVKRSHP